MPSKIAPMLAVAVAALPSDQGAYQYEYKWDGVRAIAYWDGRKLRLTSRNGNEIAHRYPELGDGATTLGRRPMILDGEIIALDDRARPSFALLQQRMHVEDRAAIARLSTSIPVAYLLFDVLYLERNPTMGMPLSDRRALLERVRLRDPLRLSPAVVGEGETMLESAREQGLEGIIAKRNTSVYEPGRRSGAWLKMKLIARQEFVIGGWIPEQKTNPSRVGALLLGVHGGSGEGLHYVGKVGTGFDWQWHKRLTEKLKEREKQTNPFGERIATAGMRGMRGVRYVRPDLVAEVEYRRWPKGAQVQQAAFKGLRDDKPAERVVDERAG